MDYRLGQLPPFSQNLFAAGYVMGAVSAVYVAAGAFYKLLQMAPPRTAISVETKTIFGAVRVVFVRKAYLPSKSTHGNFFLCKNILEALIY